MAPRGAAALVVAVLAGGASAHVSFVPHNNQTCTADQHDDPWVQKIFGVNMGGWLVLEPWITPSLFYQFLGEKDHHKVGMDSYTFCTALGSEEANKQLRRHWDTWVTEDHIKKLASIGINSLRLPVGDWMFQPYEPFINCTAGSIEMVDKILDWAKDAGLKVLFDVHSVRGSANGLDNGGITMGLEWTSTLADVAADDITFEHWPRRTAEWMGKFDRKTGVVNVEKSNIEFTLRTLELIAKRYAHNEAVLGIEPVNEPWQFTPIEELKAFYFEGYKRVKDIAPNWRYIMHDSFRFHTKIWGGFMRGCPDIALDTHIYQAWLNPSVRTNFYANACAQKNLIYKMENEFGPVIVGEWSLATDNCAMWLNGFNDNLPGYPKLPCKFVKCADPYMGKKLQPKAPPELGLPLQGPYGTGVSGPIFGLCPTDRDWARPSAGGRHYDYRDLSAQALDPKDDDTDLVMRSLAAKKLQAFAMVAHGHFFWNFRTELEDQWSYLRAHERGWIPNTDKYTAVAERACAREDVHCTSDANASPEKLRKGMDYAVGYDPGALARFDVVMGESEVKLRKLADEIFDEFWHAHDELPDACGFNGSASLTTTPYRCAAKREASERAIRGGLNYCVGYDATAVASFKKLSGADLYSRADTVFEEYWQANRFTGATCDFGGAAVLIDDESIKASVVDSINTADPDAVHPTSPPKPSTTTTKGPATTRGFRDYEVARKIVVVPAILVLLAGLAAMLCRSKSCSAVNKCRRSSGD